MLVASSKRERDGIHVADRHIVALLGGSSSYTTESINTPPQVTVRIAAASAWLAVLGAASCPNAFAPAHRLALGDLSAGDRDSATAGTY